MTYLKKKSELNRKSSELLIKNKYYASSVHCNYYSCLQLMKHILISSFNMKETNIDSTSAKNKTSSHNFILNIFLNKLKKANKNIEYNTLNKDFNSVKKKG